MRDITALNLSLILFLISVTLQMIEDLFSPFLRLQKGLSLVRWILLTLFFVSPQWWIILLFLLVNLYLLKTFIGNFNGGSDFMTTQAAIGFTISSLPIGSQAVSLGLIYMAIQLLNSYFVAGLIKIKNADWRSGRALRGFLSSSIYATLPNLNFIIKSKRLAFLFSWAVMLFEILFPLSLFSKPIAGAFLAIAALFHLGNWFSFGLNRFVWAWLVMYPAYIYLVSYLAS